MGGLGRRSEGGLPFSLRSRRIKNAIKTKIVLLSKWKYGSLAVWQCGSLDIIITN